MVQGQGGEAQAWGGRRGRGAATASGFEEPCERKWLPNSSACSARGRKGAGGGGGVEMALGARGGGGSRRGGAETADA